MLISPSLLFCAITADVSWNAQPSSVYVGADIWYGGSKVTGLAGDVFAK